MQIKPRPPKMITSRDGKKVMIIADVKFFHVEPLRPRSADEIARHERQGPLYRIHYVDSTYDQALATAQEFQKEGRRFDMSYASRLVIDALQTGDFHIEVLSD